MRYTLIPTISFMRDRSVPIPKDRQKKKRNIERGKKQEEMKVGLGRNLQRRTATGVCVGGVQAGCGSVTTSLTTN